MPKEQVPWNKGLIGYKAGEAHYNYGKKRPGVGGRKPGFTAWNKGMKGFLAGIRRVPEGFKQSEESIEKRRLKLNGKNHWNWQGGISLINRTERQNAMNLREYKIWRRAVFEKDMFICQICSIKGNKSYLQADHIKPWSLFPDLRYAIDNGQTLCLSCHKLKTTNDWKLRNLKGGDYYCTTS